MYILYKTGFINSYWSFRKLWACIPEPNRLEAFLKAWGFPTNSKPVLYLCSTQDFLGKCIIQNRFFKLPVGQAPSLNEAWSFRKLWFQHWFPFLWRVIKNQKPELKSEFSEASSFVQKIKQRTLKESWILYPFYLRYVGRFRSTILVGGLAPCTIIVKCSL